MMTIVTLELYSSQQHVVFCCERLSYILELIE